MLFFISGLISCIVYLVNRNAKPKAVVDVEGRPISIDKPTFPVVGIGSLVLGVALAAFPTIVVHWMVYIFGAILILGAVGQYVTLAGVVKLSRLGVYFWLMPKGIVIIGAFGIKNGHSGRHFFIGYMMVAYNEVDAQRLGVSYFVDSLYSAVKNDNQFYARMICATQIGRASCRERV